MEIKITPLPAKAPKPILPKPGNLYFHRDWGNQLYLAVKVNKTVDEIQMIYLNSIVGQDVPSTTAWNVTDWPDFYPVPNTVTVTFNE